MPIINTTGRVLAGQGGIQGSLDGQLFPFPSYGGGCWLTDEIALVQLQTDQTATWMPDTTPLDIGPGANDAAANGGAFVAWRGGYGVFGSLESRLLGTPGYETPDAVRKALSVAGTCGPRSVGPDGTIAFVPDRQYGYGIAILAPNGARVDVPGIVPWDVQVLGPGCAIWRGGAVGRPPTRPAMPDAQGVQLHRLNGVDWLLFWSEACGLVLQQDGAPAGWLLDPRPLEFNPSAAVVGTSLQIAWSITQGEGANDIVVCALTSAGTIEYLRGVPGWTPQVPVWSGLPPAPDPPDPPDPEPPDPEPPDPPDPEPPDPPDPEPPDPPIPPPVVIGFFQLAEPYVVGA